MKIGFTGTQYGMTPYQAQELGRILDLHKSPNGLNEFHHGDCIGSDHQAGYIAYHKGYRVVTHPPADEKKRAFDVLASEVLPVKPYLQRNRDIVDAVEVMFATPKSMQEELRSGTWATIRYARKIGRRLVILRPSA